MPKEVPIFSVVIATYGRGGLIVPTLESVRNQEFIDFEVLVVSDGPADAGLERAVSTFDNRFKLHSTHTRSRSQSGPNNEGWRLAQGKYIAYLGHDDIWHPRHLLSLHRIFEAEEDVDFAVSGCIYFGPPGMEDELTWISGLFDEEIRAPLRTFFPPSSFSHRKDLVKGLTAWPDAMATRRPVDNEFLIKAVEAGSRFVSTKEITVFKFASALRYLSYLQPDDFEQREMLDRLKDKTDSDNFIANRIELAKRLGGYMTVGIARRFKFRPGEKVRANEVVRGINLPKVRHISQREIFEIADDDRGYDWHRCEGRKLFRRSSKQVVFGRWSGPSNQPRLLLPFSAAGPATIVLHVAKFASEDIRDSLRIYLEGKEISFDLVMDNSGYQIKFAADLNDQRASVLQLAMNRTALASNYFGKPRDRRKIGLCLTAIEIFPT